MNNKFQEFILFLKKLGIDNINEEEKNLLHSIFLNNGNPNALKKELELLLALNKTLIQSYSNVSISNMLKIYQTIDANLLIKLLITYEEIKEKSANKAESFQAFKNVAIKILSVNEQVNKNVVKSYSDSIKKSVQIKNMLFSVLKNEDKANQIFNNCVNRSNLFIRECNIKNLEDIVVCLKKNFNLNDDELIKISNRCASFFISSSASKINSLYRTINEFKEFIRTQEVNANNKKIEFARKNKINNLLYKDFKDILIEASSIATFNPNSINKTIKFLMGEPICNIIDRHTSLGNLRGNFTPLQLAKIYNESITSLSIGVEKIVDVCDNISKVYKETYNEDLDINDLINGHNFSSINQLRKEDYMQEGKIKEVFELLSFFLSKEDMQNLLKNDFSFLIAPIESVKSSLKATILSSTNEETLKNNVLRKIKGHFDMYDESSYHQKEKKENVNIGLLKKVKIKEMSEKYIITILEKLNSSVEDISTWHDKWKMEKEYKELEIQLQLESIHQEISDLRSFLKIDFISIEQYIEDTMSVKDLYVEIKQRYLSIIDNKDMSPSLCEYSEKVNKEFLEIEEGINSNISFAIESYELEADVFKKELEQINKSLQVADDLNKKSKKMDEMIVEKNISEEQIIKNNKIINDIHSFINYADSIRETILDNENLASQWIYAYRDFIFEENRRQIIKNGFETIDFKESVIFKLARFIKSMEVEGLIDNGLEALSINFHVPDITYKEYIKTLNSEERRITDKIYNLYFKNIEDKKKIKKLLFEFLDKFNLKISNKKFISEGFILLDNFADILIEEVNEGRKILREKENLDIKIRSLDLEEIHRREQSLKNEIERFGQKIELLTKEQIKR